MNNHHAAHKPLHSLPQSAYASPTNLKCTQGKLLKLGLGCMGMSEFYGKRDDKESINAIHHAYELGVTHFDTADVYGRNRHNEVLLGKALKTKPRNKIFIASKCGILRNEETGAIFGINGSPQYIKDCCEKSLQHLGVDYIDLFYLHRLDPNTPIEDSMQALAALVKEGKILNIGLSAVGPDTIKRAHAIYPLAALQSEYSILTRDVEQEILPLCNQLGISFVAYQPTASGFLSGKINSLDALAEDDIRRTLPRLQQENIAHNLRLVKIIDDLAIKKQVSAIQIAIAWLLAQGDNIMAIPGTNRMSHLEENFNALTVTLTEEELAYLDNNFTLHCAKGARLSKEFSQLLNNYEPTNNV